MKIYLLVLCMIAFLISACSNNEPQSESNSQKISRPFNQLQIYIDSSSYYYLRAIEKIENGGDIELVENQYSAKIAYYHQKFRSSFDSITSEYMGKRISQNQYDEIRNSISLDSVIQRSERLKQLGLNVNLE
jgi:hypothetical protein